MKSHSPKETGIPKNQSPLPLLQDEVIMFLRTEAGSLGSQCAGHTEMNPDPISGGKLEKDKLPSGKRPQEPATG